MLKIIRSDEPITVEQLVMVIYGAPGLGKSTLGFSANAPIILDFDRGSYRAVNRGDSVLVESWQDVTSITTDDLKDYETVVVDTAGRALDFLTDDIIKKNAKMGNGGALTLQGWGVLKSRFTAWLSSLKIIGKDVVLIAHMSEEKKGDEIIERLDVQGGSKGEIYKSADAMGRLYLANQRRTISFSPTDTAFGKNPGQLDALTVPEISTEPTFLGNIIDSIKQKLNALTEEQSKRQSMIADWTAKIDGAQSVEEFNALVKSVKKVEPPIAKVVKSYLHNTATEIGMTFDKKSGEYRLEAVA